ncbi:MAG TPA: cell division protein ZapA [Candidatus Hydrogenedentes bacterium]|nr:cell division protein ZapA [Candidatus Hydrogenedentota bacterium]
MMSEHRFQTVIARIKMLLPVYKDEDTSHAIAREVDERINKLEKDTNVIDTQKNAAIIAYEYAVENRELIEEHEEDIRELAKALERLASQLKELTRRFHLDAPVSKEE